jgi:hypothetical protein
MKGLQMMVANNKTGPLKFKDPAHAQDWFLAGFINLTLVNYND